MVFALVLLQPSRSVILVAQMDPVYDLDPTFPVACEKVSLRGMNLVLAADKVPHKVPPIHPSELEVKEILQVSPECRFFVLRSRHSYALAVHIGLIELDGAIIIAIHSREKHLSGGVINRLDRAGDLLVFPVQRGPIGALLEIIRSTEILAVNKRDRTVLFTGKITHQCERVVRLILVCRRLDAGADDHHAEYRESDQDGREAKQSRVPEHFPLLQSLEKSPEAKPDDTQDKDGGSCVVWQSETVDKNQVEICGHLRKPRNHYEEQDSEDDCRQRENLDTLPERIWLVFPDLVVIHEHDHRESQQVQHMDSD